MFTTQLIAQANMINQNNLLASNSLEAGTMVDPTTAGIIIGLSLLVMVMVVTGTVYFLNRR